MTLGWKSIAPDRLPDGQRAYYLISIDPGESNGWALAQLDWRGEVHGQPEYRKLSVVANGTSDENDILSLLRTLKTRLKFVLVEEPPVRGTVMMQQLVGRMMEVLRPRLQNGASELCFISPSQWKQYPPRKMAEALSWLCRGDYDPKNRHERDALGVLAWWWIVDDSLKG